MGEVGCRDDVDAVAGAAGAGFEADHDPADPGVFLGEDAQSLEVVAADPGTRLRFYRQPHVADHEVDLDAAGEPPVGQFLVEVEVGDVRGKFVEDPVLERFAVPVCSTVVLQSLA